MNAVRLRRLTSDHEALLALAAASEDRLVIEGTTGEPPDTYCLLLRCRSVTAIHETEAAIGHTHHIRIYLPAAYPAMAPVATTQSPLRHPHIWENGTICLGSWNPAEKLDSIVARIAAIVIYDPTQLNWRSVADESAVPWTKAHLQDLPLDKPFPGPVATQPPFLQQASRG